MSDGGQPVMIKKTPQRRRGASAAPHAVPSLRRARGIRWPRSAAVTAAAGRATRSVKQAFGSTDRPIPGRSWRTNGVSTVVPGRDAPGKREACRNAPTAADACSDSYRRHDQVMRHPQQLFGIGHVMASPT